MVWEAGSTTPESPQGLLKALDLSPSIGDFDHIAPQTPSPNPPETPLSPCSSCSMSPSTTLNSPITPCSLSPTSPVLHQTIASPSDFKFDLPSDNITSFKRPPENLFLSQNPTDNNRPNYFSKNTNLTNLKSCHLSSLYSNDNEIRISTNECIWNDNTTAYNNYNKKITEESKKWHEKNSITLKNLKNERKTKYSKKKVSNVNIFQENIAEKSNNLENISHKQTLSNSCNKKYETNLNLEKIELPQSPLKQESNIISPLCSSERASIINVDKSLENQSNKDVLKASLKHKQRISSENLKRNLRKREKKFERTFRNTDTLNSESNSSVHKILTDFSKPFDTKNIPATSYSNLVENRNQEVKGVLASCKVPDGIWDKPNNHCSKSKNFINEKLLPSERLALSSIGSSDRLSLVMPSQDTPLPLGPKFFADICRLWPDLIVR